MRYLIVYLRISHVLLVIITNLLLFCGIKMNKRHGKTVKSMNLALERPTERLYVLIPEEMERLLNEKAKEMNTKIAHIVRLAIAEYLNK